MFINLQSIGKTLKVSNKRRQKNEAVNENNKNLGSLLCGHSKVGCRGYLDLCRHAKHCHGELASLVEKIFSNQKDFLSSKVHKEKKGNFKLQKKHTTRSSFKQTNYYICRKVLLACSAFLKVVVSTMAPELEDVSTIFKQNNLPVNVKFFVGVMWNPFL